MVKPALGFLLVLLLAASVRGEWSVASSQAERAGVLGTEHRRVVLTESESGAEATLHVGLFSTKSGTLRVIDNPTGKDDLAAAVEKQGLDGVNGGYLEPANAPVGW